MRSPVYTKAVKEKRDILRELYGGMMTVADLTVELGYKNRKYTKEWIAQVALPGGEEIDVAALPVQVLRDEVAHAADLAVVIRPEQHTRKRIVCARLVGCVKDRLNPALVADGDIMKIDHKNPSFFCYVSLI